MQITEGFDGWIVNCNDIVDMANRIMNITEEFVKNNENRIKTQVKSIAEHASELITLYEGVLDNKS